MNKFMSINVKPFYQKTKDIFDENIPNNEYNLHYTSKGVSKSILKHSQQKRKKE